MGTGKIRERIKELTHGKLIAGSDYILYGLCDDLCKELDDLRLKTDLLEQHTGLLLERLAGCCKPPEEKDQPERSESYLYGVKPVGATLTTFEIAKDAARVMAKKHHADVIVYKIIGEYSPERFSPIHSGVQWYGPENY